VLAPRGEHARVRHVNRADLDYAGAAARQLAGARELGVGAIEPALALVEPPAGEVTHHPREVLVEGWLARDELVRTGEVRRRLGHEPALCGVEAEVAERVVDGQRVAVLAGQARALVEGASRDLDVPIPVGRDGGGQRGHGPQEWRLGAHRLRGAVRVGRRACDVAGLEAVQSAQDVGPRTSLVGGAGYRLQPRLDLLERADVERRPRMGQPQPGVALERLGPQRAQPAGDRRKPAAVEELAPVHGDELRRGGEVVAGDRVPDRLGDRALARPPGRRAPVQPWDARGRVPLQLAAELSEQRVVAVPPAAIVERDREEVAPLELGEPLGRAGLARDHVAEVGAQAVQDRGPDEEAAQLRRDPVEDLAAEVVDDVAVVPGERGEERGALGASAQREPCELEPGGPALRAPLDLRDLLAGEIEPEAAVQERGRLGVREAQMPAPQLDHLVARAQTVEREVGIRARRDRELEGRRREVEQRRERRVDARVDDLVEIVEDEHAGRVAPREVVDEQRHDDRDQVRAGREQRGLGGLARAGDDRPQRGDDPAPEAHGVVVGGVERQPRERPVLGRRDVPEREQRRLARAGRRGEQRQPRVRAAGDERDERVAGDERQAPRWHPELRRGDDGAGPRRGGRCGSRRQGPNLFH
jgi:hypothetical protein